MRFHYATSLAEDAESGDYLLFRRPEVKLRVIGPAAAMAVTALVDTGADLTIFPLRVAKRLRIATTPAQEGAAQVFGGRKVRLFSGEVLLELAQEGEIVRWKDTVWFCDFPKSQESTIILGHAGFLDYFTAEFDGKASVLTLVPNDELPPEQ